MATHYIQTDKDEGAWCNVRYVVRNGGNITILLDLGDLCDIYEASLTLEQADKLSAALSEASRRAISTAEEFGYR